MHTEQELRTSHRRLVDIFRENRPVSATFSQIRSATNSDADSLLCRGWEATESTSRLAQYIQKHTYTHIRDGWSPTCWLADVGLSPGGWVEPDVTEPELVLQGSTANPETDEQCIAWLDDYTLSHDVVPREAAHFLGSEKVTVLAKRAEQAGDWWTASKRWAVAGIYLKVHKGDVAAAMPCLKAAVAALDNTRPTDTKQCWEKDKLEITTLLLIVVAWDLQDLFAYKDRILSLVKTAAVQQDFDIVSHVVLACELYPAWATCVPADCEPIATKLAMMHVEAAQKEVQGTARRAYMLSLAYGFVSWIHLDNMSIGVMSWDALFGPCGSLLIEAAETYNYESFHRIIDERNSFDGSIGPGTVLPLWLRWGDPAGCRQIAKTSLHHFRKLLSEGEEMRSSFSFFMLLLAWPLMLYLLGDDKTAQQLFVDVGFDWDRIAEYGEWLQNFVPALGRDQASFMNTDDAIQIYRMYLALVDASGDGATVPVETVLAAIPDDPKKAAMLGVCDMGQGKLTHPMHFSAFGGPLQQALVLEKHGQKERALKYTEMQLEEDQSKGGSTMVWWQVLALRCRGRVLASMGSGKVDEAVTAFELAASKAAGRGFFSLEALSVRDLVEHVMDGKGQREEGLARLAPLLARLSGTREELAEVFGAKFIQ
jgi:hypothetical protein